ncbi:MAG: segregation/condensation protein A [bacterium]|nr:segregation/condensation protein A [bacterium]
MLSAKSNNSVYKAEFEGIKAPLGVLLHLIRRDNIDIYDIPIARITKEYLGYLDRMEQLEIEIAGEFFVLAATLMRIKVQMLLKRDDGEEDPRDVLVRNLLEYKKMVEIARSFKELEEERRKIYIRPIPAEEKSYRGEPIFELNLFEIMRTFREIMVEFEATDEEEIEPESFTIEEKSDMLLSRLEEKEQVTFRDLFKGSSSRLEVIVTFMALLELMRRLVVKSRQEGPFGEIWIYKAPPSDDELEAHSEWWAKPEATAGQPDVKPLSEE